MTPWWHETTVYQVYPRSFYDTNGDGIGDLRGVIAKLDYIADLGFEAVWLSPFFPSPLADHGYDITDYYGVAPAYGDQEDVDALLGAAHARGLKVLFDLVLSHTSDQHPWFLESGASRDNPKADWYIWRDGRGRKPPNNWIAVPGGSAWHYAPARGQWYLASFLPFQPDLNWRNPVVKAAMFAMVRHWLERGADGFRLDLFTCLMKDADFRPNPFRPGLYSGGRPCLNAPVMQHNHPDVFAFAQELRAVVDEFEHPPRILLGEVMGAKADHRRLLGGTANDGLHLAFVFDMIFLLPWQRRAGFFRQVAAALEHHFPPPFMPTLVYGNHDMRRVMSRIGGDAHLARLLALFQLTARGVPTVYMGEEIGMEDVFIPKARAQDPISRQWHWLPDALRAWLPVNLNRDMNRTPMQWTADANAGFCPPDATPWLPVNTANKGTCNVAAQQNDPDSLWRLYRDLLHLRRKSPALRAGALALLDGLPARVLGYTRSRDSERVAVLLNFGKTPVALSLPEAGALHLGAGRGVELAASRLTLPAKSGAVVGMAQPPP
ncbi:MAG: alpha-glucosidase [Candidatus Hydrogenedentota bacterium]